MRRRNAYRILVKKSIGKWPFRKPRRRRENGIKTLLTGEEYGLLVCDVVQLGPNSEHGVTTQKTVIAVRI
jgi:hypothetical protein